MKNVKPFELEDRYLVLKKSDVQQLLDKGYLGHRTLSAIQEVFQASEAERRVHSKPLREYLVLEKDWPEYELVKTLMQARMAIEDKTASDTVGVVYYKALKEIHFLEKKLNPSPSEIPVTSQSEELGKPETGKHWYLVCWTSANGVSGHSEIGTDGIWCVGTAKEVSSFIERSNPVAKCLVLTSVTPISPQDKQVEEPKPEKPETLSKVLSDCLERRPAASDEGRYVEWAEELNVLADAAVEKLRSLEKNEKPCSSIDMTIDSSSYRNYK